MADKLKEIPGKILEWWNKYTNKQKTIIVAIAALVIFTFAILVYTFTRPQYTHLKTFDNSAEAAEVIGILNDAEIAHRESDNLLTIEVLSSQISQANYALASAGYVPDALNIGDYLNGGMSTTSWQQERNFEVYVGDCMSAMFQSLSFVKEAKAIVTLADQSGTLWAQQQREESTAFIQLKLSDTCTSAQATAVARSAATILGNSTTKNITVMDYDGNLLFAGGDDYSYTSAANSMQELREQASNSVENQVKRVLLGTRQFPSIEVRTFLDIDFAEYQNQTRKYSAPDGRSEGMKSHETNFESSSSNGVAGVPGTDSNSGDLTDTVSPDYGTSEQTQTENSIDYLPDIADSSVSIPAGVIDFTASSMAITMISYREYNETAVREQGLLEDMTWDQFKEANREDVRVTVDEEYYELAAMATGISRNNIAILAYESPVFIDRERMNIEAADVLSIFMIVLILGLLGFVILRSMGIRKRAEGEEDLSVEGMLQSTPVETMEDIDVEAKSETRKLIEKFVDENPEAAANLLRNWLNEDWG